MSTTQKMLWRCGPRTTAPRQKHVKAKYMCPRITSAAHTHATDSKPDARENVIHAALAHARDYVQP